MKNRKELKKFVTKHNAERVNVLIRQGLTKEQAKRLVRVFDSAKSAFQECVEFVCMGSHDGIVDSQLDDAIRQISLRLLEVNIICFDISASEETKQMCLESLETCDESYRNTIHSMAGIFEEDEEGADLVFEGLPLH